MVAVGVIESNAREFFLKKIIREIFSSDETGCVMEAVAMAAYNSDTI
jgi:hypothetical protein